MITSFAIDRIHIALGCALLVLAPAFATAQPVSVVERKLLPFRVGTLAAVPDSFWDGLAVLRDEEDRQRSLRADISFGLTGDEAGDKSLFRLNTGIGLSRGVFPSEVSVVSRLFLQRRDGVLQEDLTSLLITYDYHSSQHLEFFAFAERFSDSFLSIQQRYEIGFGVRTGFRLGRAGEWRATENHFAAVEAALPDVQGAAPKIRAALPGGAARPGGLQEVTPVEWANLRRALADIRDALEYRQARVFLGIAASIFSEIESASLDVATWPVAAGSSSTDILRTRVPLGSEQRYRVSIRPNLRLRPTADVQITVFPYFKLPLDGPRHAIAPDGRRRLDYRRDILTESSWSIRREQTGLESVELVLTFNHFYDSVPPSLPEALIAETLAGGRVFDRTVAQDRHRVTALALRVRW